MCCYDAINATVYTYDHCKSKGFSLQSRAMKKTLLLCVLFALQFCRVASVRAVDDPGDKFLEAYFLIQEGDTAERQTDWIKAGAKYNAALEILGEIKAQSPDWNPHRNRQRAKSLRVRLRFWTCRIRTIWWWKPQS